MEGGGVWGVHVQHGGRCASKAHLGRVERIKRNEREGEATVSSITGAAGLTVHSWVLEPTQEPFWDILNQSHWPFLG